MANTRRKDIEEIREIYRKEGCELITASYKNGKSKMTYICRCGSTNTASFDSFVQCKSCSKCRITKISGENHYLYIKDRESFKIMRKLSKFCSQCIHRVIKQKRSDTYENILGYTKNELLYHLYNFENFDLIKDNFTIDHIFPIKAFSDFGIQDLKVINGLDNLKPMTLSENSSKNCNYNKEEFSNWLKSKNII